MPDKSILFISTMKGDPWGGSEEFWFRIAMHMARSGYRVHCAFYHWPSGKDHKILQLQQEGCHLTLLTNPDLATGLLGRLKKKQLLQSQVRTLLSTSFNLVCISQGGFEEVIHHPFRNLLPLLKNFVLVNHNYNESRVLNGRRKQRLFNWTHAAAMNMAASAKVFTALKKIAGFTIPNAEVIVNPLTISVKEVATGWPALNSNGNYNWVMMAQLDTARKAQDVLVKALSNLKWKQRNWELYLYGKGEDTSMLESLIEKNNLQDKVHLMGHTNKVEEVLLNAHLLLQVTHIDAMPLSVTEAMSMARPCVVSRTGDMPLWIKDGVNGYIATAVTEQGIDEVLEKAWQQKDRWPQMGLESFNLFQQKYPQPYELYYEKIFSALM